MVNTQQVRNRRSGVPDTTRAAIVGALVMLMSTVGLGLPAVAHEGAGVRVVAHPEDVVVEIGEPVEVTAQIENADELRWQSWDAGTWSDIDSDDNPSARTATLDWPEATQDLDGARVRLVGRGSGENAQKVVTDEALVTVTVPETPELDVAEPPEPEPIEPEPIETDETDPAPRADSEDEVPEPEQTVADGEEVADEETDAAADAPSVRHPDDVTAVVGDAATFAADIDLESEADTRWQSSADGTSWATVVGAHDGTLTLPRVTSGLDGRQFRAVFTEPDGTVHATEAATLSVTNAPSETYTSPSDPGVTYTVPTELKPGDDLVVSGSGWTTTSGGEGSVVTILLDARVSGDPNTVLTKRDVVNPVTGQVSGDNRLHAIVEADANGDWTATIPFPTAENSSAGDTTPAWETGQSHYIRLLSGSMKPGDASRGLGAEFDIVEEYSDQPGDSEPEYADYESPSDPSVTYRVPTELKPGDDLVVSGSGWLTSDGDQGSVVGVFLDARVSGDPNTVLTKRDVVNPVTGQVSGDNRLHAIVEADANGDWTATIPFPTAENSSAGDTTPAWEIGGTHEIRFLTGSLRPDDAPRSLAAGFDIVEEYGAPSEPAPGEPPSWPHVAVEHDSGATAWVSRDVAAGDDATIRIKGTGWTNADSDRASTVAIKLNRSGSGQYTRSGSDIVSHPSAAGDDTIWVLLAPENPANHPHVITIDEGGDFEIEFPAPGGLQAGQYLTVLFQSGLFDNADPTRAVTTPFLTVGGVEYEEDLDPGQQVTCVPSTPTPQVSFEEPTVPLGGVLRVRGTGWCHPGVERGGSRIAIKLREGDYSHLTGDLHQNRTIWALVEADGRTGDWEADIVMPDGTTATSSPGMPEGSHYLRLLTGSLKPGDAVRSVRSEDFVVGAYRPNGTPPPVEAREDLTNATRGGVRIQQTSANIRVTVPGASRGDWIFLTAYDEDGSPRYPWGDRWFRADANGRVTAPLGGTTLPVGRPKLAVQSGNQGEFGRLLGWGHLSVAGSSSSGGAANGGSGSGSAPTLSTAARPGFAAAAAIPPPPGRPDFTPDPPVASGEDLTAANAGGVTGVQDGTVVTLTVPAGAPGDWVFVYAYSEPLAVGWIQLDENSQLRVDIAGLPAGDHKLAVLDAEGELLGWAAVTVTGEEAAVAAERDMIAPAAATAGTRLLSATDWWLIAGAAVLVLFVVGLIAILSTTRRRESAS